MKKVIVILSILVIAVVAGYLIWTNYSSTTPPLSDNNLPENNLAGGDKDAHGCIGSAGYSWCELKNKCLRVFEEFCPDAVANLANEIKDKTDLTLASDGQTTFTWLVSENNVMAETSISGVKYFVKGIKRAEYNKIEEYLQNAYQADKYNQADGVEGGLRGYFVNYMACSLNFGHVQLKENADGISEPVGDNLNVSLECGYFNQNDVPKLIIAKLIQEELADKHKKPLNEVKITISKQVGDYVNGGVKFSADSETAGGMFLATKINNKWQVIYDGNGSVDCFKLKQDYKFPDEILKPNFCD